MTFDIVLILKVICYFKCLKCLVSNNATIYLKRDSKLKNCISIQEFNIFVSFSIKSLPIFEIDKSYVSNSFKLIF